MDFELSGRSKSKALTRNRVFSLFVLNLRSGFHWLDSQIGLIWELEAREMNRGSADRSALGKRE